MENIKQLCDLIRETSFAIHTYLKFGHLEKVYENALMNRLQKTSVQLKQQYPLKVYDEDGTVLGEFFADLFVEDCLLVELKACRTLAQEHTAQLLGYLRASRIEHGLLINFGSPRLQIKKYILNDNINEEES
jgi:GxxExxY protein